MKYKNKTKKHLVGGIKQKNLTLTSWQAVYKMICVPHATLTAISYSSVEGFIFKLDIPHDERYIEFYGLNNNGTDFDEPIYSLIFKIAILSDKKNDKLHNPLVVTKDNGSSDRIYKDMSDINKFSYEAYTQQNIYNTTVYPVGKPITIGVLDFSYFDSNSTQKLLRKLNTLKKMNNNVYAMLKYLNTYVRGDRFLGLITMDLVNDKFKKLYEVEDEIHMNSGEINIINSDYNYAIAQIIILFTKVNIINYDCHSGNILASKKKPKSENETRSLLIDFGRILNLNGKRYKKIESKIRRHYNTLNGSETYDRDKEELISLSFTDLYSADVDADNSENDKIIENMHKIINFIAFIDYIKKKMYYPYTTRDNPQMQGILNYLYGKANRNWIIDMRQMSSDTKNKYRKIMPIIYQLTRYRDSRNSLSKLAIEKHIKNESIFSIDRHSGTRKFNQSATEWTPLPDVSKKSQKKTKKKSTSHTVINNHSESSDESSVESSDESDTDDNYYQKLTKNILTMFGFKGGNKTKRKNRYYKHNKTRKYNQI